MLVIVLSQNEWQISSVTVCATLQIAIKSSHSVYPCGAYLYLYWLLKCILTSPPPSSSSSAVHGVVVFVYAGVEHNSLWFETGKHSSMQSQKKRHQNRRLWIFLSNRTKGELWHQRNRNRQMLRNIFFSKFAIVVQIVDFKHFDQMLWQLVIDRTVLTLNTIKIWIAMRLITKRNK